ncbi:hypothetical protein OEZ85_008734 [Tetradesmus obliquus]|uniref:Uncharacterized protein n=1 Tax=Tetradesmus obliquus TaxID=3088 RepID=A0ABY8TK21_TETOB|nr:hypothetical protein OEZ85_008734 [Tetradesmus obliquus]
MQRQQRQAKQRHRVASSWLKEGGKDAESAEAAAAAAAAAATTATAAAAAAAAAEKAEDAAAGGDPATAADAAQLSRTQPRANCDGINAVMCAGARLFKNIIWSNQAGYSCLVDVSAQHQHIKTE